MSLKETVWSCVALRRCEIVFASKRKCSSLKMRIFSSQRDCSRLSFNHVTFWCFLKMCSPQNENVPVSKWKYFRLKETVWLSSRHVTFSMFSQRDSQMKVITKSLKLDSHINIPNRSLTSKSQFRYLKVSSLLQGGEDA